jgi:hypothetical protein
LTGDGTASTENNFKTTWTVGVFRDSTETTEMFNVDFGVDVQGNEVLVDESRLSIGRVVPDDTCT